MRRGWERCKGSGVERCDEMRGKGWGQGSRGVKRGVERGEERRKE